MADMGTFRTTIAIENPLARGRRHELPETLVDTGAELTWAPALVLESLGIARQKRLGFRTADEKFGHDLVDELVNGFNETDTTYRAELRELNDLNYARFDARLEQRLAVVAVLHFLPAARP